MILVKKFASLSTAAVVKKAEQKTAVINSP
jgi:hypothetical protein